MPRVAKKVDYQAIARLKTMISDHGYLDDAVDRLAARITDHLLGVDDKMDAGVYRSANPSRNSIARLLSEAE